MPYSPTIHGVFMAVSVSLAFTSAHAGPITVVERSGTSWAPVQTVSSTVPHQSAGALPKTPENITPALKTFLDKYQPDSAAAASTVETGKLEAFPAVGLCTQQYPCFSVDRAGFANFGTKSTFDYTLADALLSQIRDGPEITFSQSNTKGALSGTFISTSDLTLEVVAAPSTVNSSILAGQVFDLFKAHGLSPGPNGVRGIAASEQPDVLPAIGLCVYGKDVDAAAAANFCAGKELDGTSMPTGSASKRGFDLTDLIGGVCGFIDLPLVCPGN